MAEKQQMQTFSKDWHGRQLSLSTGKLANQANACVLAQYGETVVMATVVRSEEEQNLPFFPLMVDFEEKLYAAGIIKGSRWVKREGQPTEGAVLTGRMIDRSIRPLFDESSRRSIQLILTVLSVDKENDHDIVALAAASAALSVAEVDWQGPIAGIRVGLTNNEFIYNPTYKQQEESDLDLIVAGDTEKAIMIECGANEVKEDVIGQAIEAAKKEMAPALELIKEFKENAQVAERFIPTTRKDEEEKKEEENKKYYLDQANKWLDENVAGIIFEKQLPSKKERKEATEQVKNGLYDYLLEMGADKETIKNIIQETVKEKVEEKVGEQILKNDQRLDGRELDEIRELNAEVDILPRNHGAGLFSRGETQTLSIVTLGAPGLEQLTEGIEGSGTKRFMHHYNFPPYSVGETKPMRSASRREIGHGALAEKALLPVVPAKEDFPYTIRVVSETLSSNGSSSMGATCASCLALMDAGVPIKKPVGGIAMGLISNEDMSEWKVLTDMQDLEDAKGGMDFKITGTRDGVTAIQLDTKTAGLPKEVVDETLKKGNDARMRVLDAMEQAIAEPNKELSPYAPSITHFYINPEKISEVIGPGGKNINKIIAEKDVSIDLEDDGLVMICGQDKQNVAEATEWIKELTKEFEPEEIVKGKVDRIMDFGALVKLNNYKNGLVHVSELAPYHVSSPGDFLEEGQEVTVKVKEIDNFGRVNLTMKNLEENEPLWKDKKGATDRNSGSGPRNNHKPRFNKDNRNRPPERR
ncbi:MAG: polyribonucleotide nucleotidyltransferase [Patescibacteria group bacterium]